MGNSRKIQCTAVAVACLAGLHAGCVGDNRRSPDPLLGSSPAALGTPAGASNPSAASAPSPPPVPPPNLATSATSPAALASTKTRPDPRSQLRIADPPAARSPIMGPPVPPGVPPPASPAARSGQSSLPPIGVAVPPKAPSLEAGTGTQPPRITSYEQAQVLLAGRGVRWQWLEMRSDKNEWRFICRVPSRDNPNLNRTYEGRGPTHLAAVQAVLDQIDRERFPE